MRRFLIALQFLTVFRLRNDLEETSADMARAGGLFPLVGLCLGGPAAALAWVLGPVIPPSAMGFLLVLTLALLTQGLHLDGLADTADGLFSHRDRDMKLAIMKDSTIGAFGAAALVLVIGLEASLLGHLAGPAGAVGAVALVPVWGRLAVSITACLSVYARPEGGLGRPFINLTGGGDLITAGGWAVVLSGLILGVPGLVTCLVVALAAVAGVRVWRSQLGGVTGDVLGAVVELGQCVGLLVITVFFAVWR
jgi:adenosylcobinamide-GDP ribazoletransferase